MYITRNAEVIEWVTLPRSDQGLIKNEPPRSLPAKSIPPPTIVTRAQTFTNGIPEPTRITNRAVEPTQLVTRVYEPTGKISLPLRARHVMGSGGIGWGAAVFISGLAFVNGLSNYRNAKHQYEKRLAIADMTSAGADLAVAPIPAGSAIVSLSRGAYVNSLITDNSTQGQLAREANIRRTGDAIGVAVVGAIWAIAGAVAVGSGIIGVVAVGTACGLVGSYIGGKALDWAQQGKSDKEINNRPISRFITTLFRSL